MELHTYINEQFGAFCIEQSDDLSRDRRSNFQGNFISLCSRSKLIHIEKDTLLDLYLDEYINSIEDYDPLVSRDSLNNELSLFTELFSIDAGELPPISRTTHFSDNIYHQCPNKLKVYLFDFDDDVDNMLISQKSGCLCLSPLKLEQSNEELQSGGNMSVVKNRINGIANNIIVSENYILENMTARKTSKSRGQVYDPIFLKQSVTTIYDVFFKNINRDVPIQISILGTVLHAYYAYRKQKATLPDYCSASEHKHEEVKKHMPYIANSCLNDIKSTFLEVFKEFKNIKLTLVYKPVSDLDLHDKLINRTITSNTAILDFDRNPFYTKGEARDRPVVIGSIDSIIDNLTVLTQEFQRDSGKYKNHKLPMPPGYGVGSITEQLVVEYP